MRSLPFITLLASLSLAACASVGAMSDTQKLALYSSHAGQPVRNIRYSRTPISWDKIDGAHLLLTMRPTEVWLLRLSGPCLDWASGSPTILISPRGGQLSAGFDRISTPESPVTCRIEEIRPVDIAAVRASQREVAAD